VQVLQLGGGLSDRGSAEDGTAVLLSYLQCGRGTRKLGNGTCARCPRNTFQVAEGQPDCQPCPSGLYQRADDPTQNWREPCDVSAGLVCGDAAPVECPADVWLYAEESTGRLHAKSCLPGRCRDAQACYSQDRLALLGLTVQHVSCCALNRPDAAANPMCGACEAGWSERGGPCVPCASANAGALVGLLLLGVMLLLFLQVSTVRRPCSRSWPGSRRPCTRSSARAARPRCWAARWPACKASCSEARADRTSFRQMSCILVN
jgi:hypothetical protein